MASSMVGSEVVPLVMGSEVAPRVAGAGSTEAEAPPMVGLLEAFPEAGSAKSSIPARKGGKV